MTSPVKNTGEVMQQTGESFAILREISNSDSDKVSLEVFTWLVCRMMRMVIDSKEPAGYNQ